MKKEFPTPFEGKPEQSLKEETSPKPEQGDFFNNAKKGKPIARRLKTLENEAAADIASEALPEGLEAIKHEAYALGAYLIELYHSHLKRTLEQQPEKLLEELQPLEILPHDLKIFSLDKEGNLVVNHDHMKLLPLQLFHYHWSNNHFPKIYNTLFQKTFRSAKPFFSAQDKAVYDRLERVLVQEKFRKNTNHKGLEFGMSVETFLSRGVGTATHESWGILLAAISGYQEHFNKEITPEVLEKLSPIMKQILIKVSSLHIEDFAAFLRFGSEKRFDADKPTGKLWHRILVFSGTADNPELELDPKFLHHLHTFKAHQLKEHAEWQQGCPARDVRVEGADGKKVSIIADVFDFYKDLAERIVLPHQRLVRPIKPVSI